MTDNTPDAPAVALEPCPRCGKEPCWGGINFHNEQGEPLRHDALRCLDCHYWFYIGSDRDETERRWNTRPTAALPSEDDVVDALRAAKLQLEYLDGRWPTGTTPPTVARIERVLAAMPPEQIANQEPQ